jgi:hypothetical protein
MMKIRILSAALIGAVFLATGTVCAQSAGNADAIARDALRRLDDAMNGKTSAAPQSPAAQSAAPAPQSPAPQGQAPAQSTRGGKEPLWVTDPYAAYPRNGYVAAVGFAPNRAEAEKKALAALTAIFGQSITADFSAVTAYSEAVSKGIISSSETTNTKDAISTRTSLDTLIGAEIGNVWDDARGTVYAIAYLDKAKAIAVYGNIVQTNLKNIENLTTMTATQKNTLDGYARYRLAALLARINAKDAGVLEQCGGPTASSLNLPSADSINIEASNIIKGITVIVTVKGDSNNRIRDAFSKTLSAEGLRTRGNSPLYTLEVNIDMSEVKLSGTNKFCRITVSAELIENSTDSVLLPFNFANREGHLTYEEAQSRAILQAEKYIGEKYPAVFKEYLDGLLPKG